MKKLSSPRLILAILSCVCLLAVFTSTAFAVPTIYSGFDSGTGSLATSPTATAAAAAFDAATSSSLITFESPLPASVSINLGTTISITNDSGCPGPLCGYNTTSGGSNFLLVFAGSTVGNPTATFTFANPIDAFGAYFTGWQVNSQTLTYADGSSVTLTMPDADFTNGGTLFYGFVDRGAGITSVTYDALNDIVAVDDVRYEAGNSVPEPATMLLLGLGLVGLAGIRRKL